MKLAVALVSILKIASAQQTFEEDCYKVTPEYGDVSFLPTDVVQSDLEKIKALENPGSYAVSSVITCLKDGRVIG